VRCERSCTGQVIRDVITIVYKDGTSETLEIIGRHWRYAGDYCIRPAEDPDSVRYIPVEGVRYIEADLPSAA
jgi:hypothetical protein